MANQEPFEIVAGPVEVYQAAVGTAFPDVADAPSGSWTLIGISGDLSYTEKGVTGTFKQKVDTVRSLGSTGPRKAFRSSEDLMFSLELMDVRAESWSQALNGNSVTTVAPGAGTAGYKKVGLSRGPDVTNIALLIRGTSPYGDWAAQFEVPVCFQSGEPKVVSKKGDPQVLEMEWTALEDPDAASDDERFGRLVEQNAEPGT